MANIVDEREKINFAADSVVIEKYVAGIPGGKKVYAPAKWPLSYLEAGHIVIYDFTRDAYYAAYIGTDRKASEITSSNPLELDECFFNWETGNSFGVVARTTKLEEDEDGKLYADVPIMKVGVVKASRNAKTTYASQLLCNISDDNLLHNWCLITVDYDGEESSYDYSADQEKLLALVKSTLVSKAS